jgi:hypothetical protein
MVSILRIFRLKEMKKTSSLVKLRRFDTGVIGDTHILKNRSLTFVINKLFFNMKKIKIMAIVIVLTLSSFTALQAQEIGLRFGDFYGNNVAIDGVFALGDFSRIHADVSFGGNGLGIDALWNPIYSDIPDTDLKWYAGFGPSIYLSENFRFGAAAEIGTEYAFSEVPITIGLDFRPYLFLVEITEFRAGFGLNARWRFN